MSIRNLKCHSSHPLIREGRVGERRAPHGLGGGDVWHLRLGHTQFSW